MSTLLKASPVSLPGVQSIGWEKLTSSDGQFDNSLTFGLASGSGVFLIGTNSREQSERKSKLDFPSDDFLFILGNLLSPVGDCRFRDAQRIHG